MSQYANLPAFLGIEHIPAGPSQLVGPYQRLSSVRRVMEASPTGAVVCMAVLPLADHEYFDILDVWTAARGPESHGIHALKALRAARQRLEAEGGPEAAK